MGGSKNRRPLTSIVGLAERLARRIATKFPDARFILRESERHPGTYVLYVLDAPRDEHSVLRLIAKDAADILEEKGVHILVEPFSKGYRPDILLTTPTGEQIAIEIKVKQGTA